jgi:hypothetical protein
MKSPIRSNPKIRIPAIDISLEMFFRTFKKKLTLKGRFIQNQEAGIPAIEKRKKNVSLETFLKQKKIKIKNKRKYSYKSPVHPNPKSQRSHNRKKKKKSFVRKFFRTKKIKNKKNTSTKVQFVQIQKADIPAI